MDVLSLVKRKANLPSLMLGAGSVLAGSGAAAIRGYLDILAASICLLFVIFAQLAANFGHYYLEIGRYYANLPRPKLREHKWYGNLLVVRVFREASFAAMIMAGMLALTIMTMAGSPWWVMILGIVVVGINLLLSFGKHPLYGTPWAVVFTGILFGPAGVIGTALLQVQHKSPTLWSYFDISPAIFLGLAMGLLACNIYLMYAYFVNKMDPDHNPRSIVSRIGMRGVEWLLFTNGFLQLAMMSFLVWYFDLPRPELAIVPSFLGFALNTYVFINMRRAPIGELVHLNMLTKINMLLMGLLTFLIWWYIGAPDDSLKVVF